MDFTFGITTSGLPDSISDIVRVIDSIRTLKIPNYEIIVVGGDGGVFSGVGDVVEIPFDESQRHVWITKKKNIITQFAKYENVVYTHDYIKFEPDWYKGFLSFGENYKICMNRIINFDGSRYRDWNLCRFTPEVSHSFQTFAIARDECLLPYNETSFSKFMYFSGSYWVAKKSVMQEFPQNENLLWGDGEDIEWSHRVRRKYDFSMNADSSVKIMKSGKEAVFTDIPIDKFPLIKTLLLQGIKKLDNRRLAVVIPYRNREEHLKLFVPKFKEFMGDAQYRIFVIEQNDNEKFNRAKLLNIGFAETKNDYDYYAFHDVDMIPVETDYSFPDCPTHLATAAEQNNYMMPYDTYFGGVTLFNKSDFEKINGYSNMYFGYGAEDDDLLFRCQKSGLNIQRRHGKYNSLPHDRNFNGLEQNRQKYYDLITGRTTFESTKVEGLNSLQYTVVERVSNADYDLIRCNL